MWILGYMKQGQTKQANTILNAIQYGPQSYLFGGLSYCYHYVALTLITPHPTPIIYPILD